MKNFVFTVAVTVLLVATSAFAQEVLPVENWIKIGEERQVFNNDFGSGLVKRYYIDPDQNNGAGSMLSVFYKDGTEELFWKGWNLYTEKAQAALLYQGKFVLQPMRMTHTANMKTLKDMASYIAEQAMQNPARNYLRNGEFYLLSFEICLAADSTLNVLKDEKGLDVCYIIFLERNTKP